MPSPSADPKPVAPIKKVVDYRPLTDIKDALTSAASDPATAAPTDNGVIDLLVQRPSGKSPVFLVPALTLIHTLHKLS